MRSLYFFTIAFTSIGILSSAQEPPDPADLIKLRDSWQRAVQQANAPLDKKYEEALIAMKTRFTKEGKLQEALAVDNELTMLASRAINTTSAPASESEMPPLVGAAWHWTHSTYDKPTTFKEDGTFENGWFIGTWTLKGRKLHLKLSGPAKGARKTETVLEAKPKTKTYEGPDGFGANIVLQPPQK